MGNCYADAQNKIEKLRAQVQSALSEIGEAKAEAINRANAELEQLHARMKYLAEAKDVISRM